MTTQARPVFNVEVASALDHGQMVEITTRGRHSGQLRRLPVAFHNIGGRIYISGRPGKRGWYANLLAEAHFTFHLIGGPVADLPATARAISTAPERRRLLGIIAEKWGYAPELMTANAPLVEVEFSPGVR